MSQKVVLFWSEVRKTKEDVTKILKQNGYEVLIAKKRSQCLKYLSYRHVDLVLLDIQLDDLGGLMLTKKIRSLSKHRHTPIISLTDNNIMPQMLNVSWGCDDYISKPINRALLLSKMDSLLEKYFY